MEPRRCLLQAESTDVRFQTLSAEVIRTYLARIQPLDKAGGYAIQEHAELILSAEVIRSPTWWGYRRIAPA